jgi:hypothetical protein
MVIITVVGAVAARAAVKDQESRLLKERTNEIGLVLTSSISSLPGPLDVLGGVLRATNQSASAFGQASAAAEVGTSANSTFALVRKADSGYVVVMAKGPGLRPGEMLSGVRAAAFQTALTNPQIVPTGVIGSGAKRSLGFALGPPVAPAGTVLYREDPLGPIGAPRSAKTAPFSELNVVIYDSPRPARSEVLAETTTALPLKGQVRTQPLPAGAATWTLQASAASPLVGTATEDAPWIVLAGGICLALLVGLVTEVESRRRRSAVALYDSEHRVAETLQRSLLPSLPTLPGLDLAARYLPAALHQEIGGDWFDVFELADGRIGLVIGDVVGHDVAAAAAMAKVQSSLRAYGWSGAPPNEVLDRLDGFIANFRISDLVTVFYGVLSAPDDSGGRTLTFANAGHLPPFVRDPDGSVRDLSAAPSLLLGAPSQAGAVRPQGAVVLSAGSTLLLFTDGLIEVPGESLTTSLARLGAQVAAAPAGADAASVCDLLLTNLSPERLRDDVAVLTIQLDAVVAAARPLLAQDTRA